MEIENSPELIQHIVSQIKLSDRIKEHLIYTEKELSSFLEQLSNYSAEAINLFLLDTTINENYSSTHIENETFSKQTLCFYQEILSFYPKLNKDILSNLSKVVLINSQHPNIMAGTYRDCLAWVGRPGCTLQTASYVFPKENYIESLMEQFYYYYNASGNSELDNPIIKSAIAHILLVKIHPFKDGNGRIARILHHHKFTELINKKYDFNFRLPIINLSQHLELSRGNYYKNENMIHLDSKNQNNEYWNNWFDYILNMIDEQTYFLSNKLKSYNTYLSNLHNNKSK